MAAQTHVDSNEPDNRFWRHFPLKSNDITLVVLKGHLLLEETVNSLLAALVREPQAIEDANLRFHQKLCLIQALAPVDPHSRTFRFRMTNAAQKLNTVRNKLAHHLDYPRIEALLEDFLSLCEAPEDLDLKAQPLHYRLKLAVLDVCTNFEIMSRSAWTEAAGDRQVPNVSQVPFPSTGVATQGEEDD